MTNAEGERRADRRARVARNESASRQTNEEVVHVQGVQQGPTYLRILCECGYGDCEQLVAITREEYEEIRRDPRRFAIEERHVIPDAESIVSRTDRFIVVEKLPGLAAEIVEREDPRS